MTIEKRLIPGPFWPFFDGKKKGEENGEKSDRYF